MVFGSFTKKSVEHSFFVRFSKCWDLFVGESIRKLKKSEKNEIQDGIMGKGVKRSENDHKKHKILNI